MRQAARFWGTLVAAVWLLAHVTLAVEAVRKVTELEARMDGLDAVCAAVLRGRHHYRAALGLDDDPEAGMGSVTLLRSRAG